MNLQHNAGITSEEIYEDLCRKIEHLEYMPGDRLSENDLCQIYGVSRHMVRNALTGLKQRRLMDIYPQRGSYVSLIDMEYISDILYIRESVEQEALARIMEMEDRDAVIAGLKESVAAQKRLDPGPAYNEEFSQLDNAYHQTLLSAVGKPNVMSLVAEPYIHIRRWRNYEIRTEQRMKEIIGEHESLIAAIESGDAGLAREKLHIHLDTVSRYSKALKEQETQYFV